MAPLVRFLLILSSLLLFCLVNTNALAGPPSPRYVILYVWDGLRADAVTPQTAPHLYQLMRDGVQFTDNHSSYPTLTMMNAASFATGDRAGKTGFYGNTLWQPGIHGLNALGGPVDFNQPVFTEDYQILTDLAAAQLFFVPTLFQVAHQHHLTTATIGKLGPAFMQDYLSEGNILDEKHLAPLNWARKLQSAGLALPKYAPLAFHAGDLILAPTNGDPTAASPLYFFSDGVTTDPIGAKISSFNSANQYMVDIYLSHLLIEKPALSVIWMRNPDSTEHAYGPGTEAYYSALRSNDQILGELIQKLEKFKMIDETDIIIVSDHAHSTVSGPFNDFPLRNAKGQKDLQGESSSGAIRAAHLLTLAGFHAYDGMGCRYNPVMAGIKADGALLYPTQIDRSGKQCGKPGMHFTTPAYFVPHVLPKDAIIVAANGGSDYFYLPSHDIHLAKKLVAYLQSHTLFDVIFVDESRYPNLPGTLSLATVHLQNIQGRGPDIISGLSYDEKAKINGSPGIEFSDSTNERGMHGSFSPIDVHNFLAAMGPDFKKHFQDKLPTGNVDVAATIAYLLELPFASEGRVLFEALNTKNKPAYSVNPIVFSASLKPAKNLSFYDVFDKKIINKSQYVAEVRAKLLTDGLNYYVYFDAGRGIRD